MEGGHVGNFQGTRKCIWFNYWDGVEWREQLFEKERRGR